MEYSEQIKEIYNEIANRFDISRVRIWPCVKKFLDTFKQNDLLLDVGCGNGKNMLYRNDLKFKGLDFSSKLIEICKNKNLDVIESSMTNIPLNDNYFDGIIVIASYHHLSNDYERTQTLNELYRVLKNGGKVLIVVWAMEQPDESTFHFTKTDEFVKWYSKENDKTYYRYYHIYKNGELEEEINRLKPEFKTEYIYLEKGNWVICLEK